MAEVGQTREVEVELIDGSNARIRPISPADANLLRAGWLSDSMVTYLTDVDHHDHEAILAIDPKTGEGTGVARYVRDPGGSDAEAAVTVADEWRGLGTALLELLADRAREEGVRRFKAFVLADNRPMLEVQEGLGYAERMGSAGEPVELTMERADDGLGPELHDALRVAARQPLRLVMRLTPLEPRHPLEIADASRPPADVNDAHARSAADVVYVFAIRSEAWLWRGGRIVALVPAGTLEGVNAWRRGRDQG